MIKRKEATLNTPLTKKPLYRLISKRFLRFMGKEKKRSRIGKNIDKAMSSNLDLEMPNKIRNNCKLASCWTWDKKVNDFVKSKVKGYSLNVCAGLSPIGDVKVDLDPKKKDVGMANMNNLPFEDNTFDSIISDPPWKIGFFQRMKPFFECVRVCKVGGRIIYNSTWRPLSKCVKLEESIIRTDNNWSNVSVIWIFKKIRENQRKSTIEGNYKRSRITRARATHTTHARA